MCNRRKMLCSIPYLVWAGTKLSTINFKPKLGQTRDVS
jgi:hypothetical protein